MPTSSPNGSREDGVSEVPQPMKAAPSTTAYTRQPTPRRRPIRRSSLDLRPEVSTNTGPSAEASSRLLLRRPPRLAARLSMAGSDCIHRILGSLYVGQTLRSI
ncbi:hypothetical protein QF032_004561 [Streptomyces achromogenes]|nr:hypothetical protein [Streptomyces achromogenes]